MIKSVSSLQRLCLYAIVYGPLNTRKEYDIMHIKYVLPGAYATLCEDNPLDVFFFNKYGDDICSIANFNEVSTKDKYEKKLKEYSHLPHVNKTRNAHFGSIVDHDNSDIGGAFLKMLLLRSKEIIPNKHRYSMDQLKERSGLYSLTHNSNASILNPPFICHDKRISYTHVNRNSLLDVFEKFPKDIIYSENEYSCVNEDPFYKKIQIEYM